METRTVKTVRIFLASSSELHNDRVAFADFIERLQNHYESRNYSFLLKKWEYLDPGYKGNRKQDEYNEVIMGCDLFVVIFFNRVGKYTREELEVALNECILRKSLNKPVLPLFIYFRKRSFFDKLKCGSGRLRELQNHISSDLKHFWGVYDTNDKLHLDFALWLDSYLFDGKSEFKTVNGNVVLGDVIIAKLKQLPFAANNEDFKRLSKTIQEYPEKIEKLRKRTEKFPVELESRDELQQALNDYNGAIEEFARFQQTLLDTAKFIADRRQDQTDDKLQLAVDAFEAGDMTGANSILNEIDIEADEFNKHFEKDRSQMHKYIEAFQLQTKTVMAKVEKPIEDRVASVAEIYAKADDWAERSNYDKKKYASLLFDYAKFLTNFARYQEAEKVFIRQIKMSEDLYGKDSADTAASYNELGLLYMVQNDFEIALQYYKKSLEIRKKVLGVDHHDTAISYNNIGGIYQGKGDYDKALDYYLKALEIQERVQGVEHPDTATFNNNIGSIYHSQGEFGKALIHHLKALTIDEKVFGVDHPNTATDYNNIGLIYYFQDDYYMAMEYLKKALEILEKKLGHDHPFSEQVRDSIEAVEEAIEESESR